MNGRPQQAILISVIAFLHFLNATILLSVSGPIMHDTQKLKFLFDGKVDDPLLKIDQLISRLHEIVNRCTLVALALVLVSGLLIFSKQSNKGSKIVLLIINTVFVILVTLSFMQ
ncbi:MAG: hypothetical protein C5B49_15200 [Bdellovibrio sp.]|nr:MAG: hypothetical protein C5B49_15200 [Bdellovibrio sp.]